MKILKIAVKVKTVRAKDKFEFPTKFPEIEIFINLLLLF